MITPLEHYDPQVFELLRQEGARQSACIRLIPSENYVSKAVMAATGSCLTNKYAEGYPGKRYYEGQQITDLIESIAIERAKKLFKADHVNVQSHSGAVANLAAYSSVAAVGDTIMGLALPYGGHLSHGWKVNFTSKIFNSVSYDLDPETCEKTQTENHHYRRKRISSQNRFQNFRRDCQKSWRISLERHRTHKRSCRGRAASKSGSLCGYCFHDNT